MRLALLLALAASQWQPVTVPSKASFRGLSAVDENIVWVSGTEGTVLRTTDSGKSWDTLKVPKAEDLDFRGIRAFDDKTAVVMSSGPAEKGQARIYRTTDGGKNWKLVLEEKTKGAFFDAVAFLDTQLHGLHEGRRTGERLFEQGWTAGDKLLFEAYWAYKARLCTHHRWES